MDFHSDFEPLRVKTSEIGLKGHEVSLTLSPIAFNSLIAEKDNDFSFEQLEPVGIFARLEPTLDAGYTLRIRAQAKVQTACVRCLEHLIYPINLDCFLRMLPENQDHTGNSGLESFVEIGEIEDLNEFSVGYYQGNVIDVGLIMREQFFHLCPDYPRCNDAQAEPKRTCAMEAVFDKLTMPKEEENPFVRFFKNKN